MFKTWLRRTHLLLALPMIFFVINLSISGALLVFAKEIEQQFAPQRWLVFPGTEVLPLPQLIKAIEQITPERVKSVAINPDPHQAWQLQTHSGEYLSVNPYTADILYRYEFQQRFYGFVMAWHRWLLVETEQGSKPLKWWVSMASLMLIVQMLLGFWMWLKPKQPLKRLKINFAAKPKVKYYQLHTVVGVFTMIPLILIAFSGMAFHWSSQTRAVVETLTGQTVERHQQPLIEANTNAKPQLALALENGLAALPQGQLHALYLPSGEQPLKLRIKMPGESHPYSWVWVNPYTGKVLKAVDASKSNIATQIWHFKFAFHTGEFFGLGSKLIWLLLALLPMAFAFSGIWLAFKRINKQKRKTVVTCAMPTNLNLT